MKKIILVCLIVVVVLTGCSQISGEKNNEVENNQIVDITITESAKIKINKELKKEQNEGKLFRLDYSYAMG